MWSDFFSLSGGRILVMLTDFVDPIRNFHFRFSQRPEWHPMREKISKRYCSHSSVLMPVQ